MRTINKNIRADFLLIRFEYYVVYKKLCLLFSNIFFRSAKEILENILNRVYKIVCYDLYDSQHVN